MYTLDGVNRVLQLVRQAIAQQRENTENIARALGLITTAEGAIRGLRAGIPNLQEQINTLRDSVYTKVESDERFRLLATLIPQDQIAGLPAALTARITQNAADMRYYTRAAAETWADARYYTRAAAETWADARYYTRTALQNWADGRYRRSDVNIPRADIEGLTTLLNSYVTTNALASRLTGFLPASWATVINGNTGGLTVRPTYSEMRTAIANAVAAVEGGGAGEQGETGPRGPAGVGITAVASSQVGNTVTLTFTRTAGSALTATFMVPTATGEGGGLSTADVNDLIDAKITALNLGTTYQAVLPNNFPKDLSQFQEAARDAIRAALRFESGMGVTFGFGETATADDTANTITLNVTVAMNGGSGTQPNLQPLIDALAAYEDTIERGEATLAGVTGRLGTAESNAQLAVDRDHEHEEETISAITSISQSAPINVGDNDDVTYRRITGITYTNVSTPKI